MLRLPFVIGTRGSPLALAQARMVQAALAVTLGVEPEGALPIRVIRTSGDRIQDRALAEVGGKGLWTKEIDAAQLDGTVSLGVHSAKDLPTLLPEGLVLAGTLAREDVRDAFISPHAATLDALPPGALVGSASLRRQAQVLRHRPDLRVTLFRGNVETRLAKMDGGEADATLLALAGLNRLGLADRATAILPVESFLPAVGQGTVAITARLSDGDAREAVARITHEATLAALLAERAYLAVLDGSCRTPIAGHAVVTGGQLRFRGEVLRPDGSDAVEAAEEGAAADAVAVGRAAGERLSARLPAGFMAAA